MTTLTFEVIGVDQSGSKIFKQVGAAADQTGKKLDGFGSKAGAVLGAAGLAAGTAFAAGLIKTVSVEAANDKLAAQLGLTEEESARIGGVAGRLYADAYGESIEHVNTAVSAVVSSIDGMRNANDDAVGDMTAKVLDLATAFEIDVGRSAQVAGQMVKSGLAKDATEALDMITLGLQRVPAAVREDLLDAMDEYAPFMQGLGIKGAAAIGLLINASDKGAFGLDKMADSLKEFLIRATDLGPASKVGYDALGMNQEKFTKLLLAGGDTAKAAFEQIVTGLSNIQDPAKQSQAALALFGPPLEDLSVQEIPRFLESLTGAGEGMDGLSGAADKMGDTLNDNAQTKITGFTRSLEKAFVEFLGGKVIPEIEKAVNWLRDNFGPELEAVGKVINEIAVPALIALGVVAVLAAAKMAVAWLAALGPIGLIIAAVALAAALIISHWDDISKYLELKWSIIAGRAEAVWDWIKLTIIDKVTAAARWVGDRVTAIGGFFGMLAGIPGRVAGWFGDLTRSAIGKLDELINWIKGLPGRILGALGNLGGLLVEAGKDIIRGLIRGLEQAWHWLQSKLSALTNMIPAWKGPPARDRTLLVDNGRLIMGGLLTGLEDATPDVRDYLTGLTNTLPLGLNAGMSMPVLAPSTPPSMAAAPARIVLELRSSGASEDEMLLERLRRSIRVRGGDVQLVLGP